MSRLIPLLSSRSGSLLQASLQQRAIHVQTGFPAGQIDADAAMDNNGPSILADATQWATGAKASLGPATVDSPPICTASFVSIHVAPCFTPSCLCHRRLGGFGRCVGKDEGVHGAHGTGACLQPAGSDRRLGTGGLHAGSSRGLIGWHGA